MKKIILGFLLVFSILLADVSPSDGNVDLQAGVELQLDNTLSLHNSSSYIVRYSTEPLSETNTGHTLKPHQTDVFSANTTVYIKCSSNATIVATDHPL